MQLTALMHPYMLEFYFLAGPKPVLKAVMSTSKFFYVPGEDVKLKFELTNESLEDYYILDWHTPFEGFLSEFLDVALVTLTTEEVGYNGQLVKRGRPSSSDYLRLPAGSTLNTTVVLNDVYDISSPGIYRVVLSTALRDVKKTYQGDNSDPARLWTGFKHIPLYTDRVLFVIRNASRHNSA